MIPKECEEQFQIELKRYRATNSKTSWDLMWVMVNDCCSNIAKSKLKGVKCPDFDGKVMDATIKCMEGHEAELETMHDLDKIAAKLYMLQKLGYINEDEYADMIDYADDLRNKLIKKEGEEDGKEN